MTVCAVQLPVVRFIVPDCGILVDSGIGSSYRLARLHRLEGPVRKPYAGVNIYPPFRDYEFGYVVRPIHPSTSTMHLVGSERRHMQQYLYTE